MSQFTIPLFKSTQASFEVVDGFNVLSASIFFSLIHSFSHFILSGVRENGCDFYALCYCSIYSFDCFGQERARMRDRGVV